MSRIGNLPIELPEGVEITQEGQTVTVKGKNGELSREIHPLIKLEIEDNEVTFVRANEQKQSRMLHGTTRSMVNNMVVGVTEGYTKKLNN